MQLLNIRTIPIQYQYQIERARLQVHQAEFPRMETTSRPSKLSIDMKPVQIRLDTTDMRKSMGLRDVSAVLSDSAQKGLETAQQVTAEMAQFGNQLGEIHKGVTVAGLITQKMLQQPDTITKFLPSVGPVISWEPNQISMQYDPGEVSTQWELSKNLMDFVPGKFQMIIEQYPSVEIEYMGKPRYVPPSAAPDYEGQTA